MKSAKGNYFDCEREAIADFRFMEIWNISVVERTVQADSWPSGPSLSLQQKNIYIEG